ncbi:MAG: ATP-binding protein [Pricia sp.]
MKTEKIVITGGPSTGKTSVIKALENRGYYCIHELIRDMTAAEKEGDTSRDFTINPILSVEDPTAFNTMLLEGRIAQYESIKNTAEKVVFFDRGIPDVHAYMDCFGQPYNQAFEQPARTFRYDRVLLMPPWREIHVTDAERFETFEEAVRIFTALEKAYQNFGYDIVLVPKGSIVERTDFILDLIHRH